MSDGPPDAEDYNFFGFTPSLAAGGVFLALFGALTIIHLALTIKSRRWWGLITVAGGVTEVIGWIGRTGGHFQTTGLTYYLMQQVCCAIAPTFFSATCYVMFGLITLALGTEYSRLKPKKYALVFVLVDIFSLVLQGIGGGMSGSAAGGSGASLSTGRNLYLAGISVQLACMLGFCGLVVEYFWKIRKAGKLSWSNIGGTPMKLLLVGLWGASLLIIGRNIFREFELAEGFDGHLAVTQGYFWGLDAAPMVACMAFLAISHPVFTFDKLGVRNANVNSTLADYQAEKQGMTTA